MKYSISIQRERVAKYRKTKKGIINQIYNNQKFVSKKRKMEAPKYTLKELREFMLKQSEFHTIYKKWEESGYKKELVPSIDRLDDYKGYSFSNIRITTWAINKQKGHNDIFNGINTKQSNTVVQYDLQMNKVSEYNSRNEAMRKTGILHISDVCNGNRKTAGGYIWKYSKRRHKCL